METKTISIPEWAEMARAGLPVTASIFLDGDSMRPLIRRRKDRITIVPLKRALCIGDVVLFTDGRRYVVHRVYKISPDRQTVQTWGDNCWAPDEPVSADQVLGLVTDTVRFGRKLNLDSESARRWGRFWMKPPFFRNFWVRCCHYMLRRAEKH